MASPQNNMSSSAQQKQELLIAEQEEALGPARIEKLLTTSYKTKKPYVPGATLRLQDLRNVTEKGSLTSEEVSKVKAWRCKCIYHLQLGQNTCSLYSVAAAAAGAVLENPPKSTPAGPSDGPEKIGAAKGPSADSEWGDNLILL